MSTNKWQRAEVEILRAPTQDRGIQGDDECTGAALLSPADHRVDQRLIVGPVQLVPERPRIHRCCCLLQRVTALTGDHVRRAGCGCPLGGDQRRCWARQSTPPQSALTALALTAGYRPLRSSDPAAAHRATSAERSATARRTPGCAAWCGLRAT